MLSSYTRNFYLPILKDFNTLSVQCYIACVWNLLLKEFCILKEAFEKGIFKTAPGWPVFIYITGKSLISFNLLELRY